MTAHFLTNFENIISRAISPKKMGISIMRNSYLTISDQSHDLKWLLKRYFKNFLKIERSFWAMLSHFRYHDELEMVKFEFCIIKTIIIPIEFFLLALEMNFSRFWKTRAFYVKNLHFHLFPVTRLIRNGQIWILYHQKLYHTHFCGSGSTRNDIYTI